MEECCDGHTLLNIVALSSVRGNSPGKVMTNKVVPIVAIDAGIERNKKSTGDSVGKHKEGTNNLSGELESNSSGVAGSHEKESDRPKAVSGDDCQYKTIYLIRHGQSTFNAKIAAPSVLLTCRVRAYDTELEQ